MADELMYIPNDDTQASLSLDFNYLLKSLDTKLGEPNQKNQSPKLLRKLYYKTLGTSNM